MIRAQQATDQHRLVRDEISHAIGEWRRFLVAVDGIDGSGKSTLTRYLSWQLGAPAVETDLFLASPDPSYRLRELEAVLEARLSNNRPVIVEGIFVLETLASLDFTPDFQVRVKDSNRQEGAHRWHEKYQGYLMDYPDAEVDFIFSWSSAA